MPGRLKWRLLAAALVALTAFSIFVLPFLFPPAYLAGISSSNAAGFNNRVAVVAAASLSAFCVVLFGWMRLPGKMPRPEECAPLSGRFIWGWSIAAGLLAACCVFLVYVSHLRYEGDYGYFIAQMSKAADYGKHLYTEIELPYGPLLFYPPIWIRGAFGWCARPLAAAYGVTYVVQVTVGLLLLAYVVQALPIATRLRQAAFLAFVIFSFSPNLGLNYTFFRFATPLAILLFCLRRRSLRTAALLAVPGQMLALAISPEMGFAFAFGVAAYALLHAWRYGRRWVALALAPLAGCALLLPALGRGFLRMVALFSGGIYNFIVEPQPYILLYLLALVWLVPMMLQQEWRDGAPDADLHFALYAMGLALVPVAFGRADAGHVLYNGLAVLLLALVPVSAWQLAGQAICAAALIAVVAFSQLVSVINFRYQIQAVPSTLLLRLAPVGLRRFALRLHTPTTPGSAARLYQAEVAAPPAFPIEALKGIAGLQPVFVPFTIPLDMEEALERARLYQPGFYFFNTAVVDRVGEVRQVNEMNTAAWALLPAGPLPTFAAPAPEFDPVGIVLPYHARRSSYTVGHVLLENLQQNWHLVTQIDGYRLYRRNW